ncbi:MAG: hypothetical protein IAG10_04725 [Planctomycetaceae bacterium]|nr:hypothetical protein [Planctomycetaceae bacterium]
MTTLTASAVLKVWEQTVGLPHCGRAWQLWLSLSGRAMDGARDVTIGECDRELIAVHRALFGRNITGRADCPQCHEMLELDLDLEIFDLPQPLATDRQLHLENVDIEWRFPTARELADLARTTNGASEVRVKLLQYCVTAVRRESQLLKFEEWPGNLAAELGVVMVSADPLLDPGIELACDSCGHAWSVRFDIATFLWSEIDDVARRLMSEVHRLATAYGWGETEILELTAARRAAYLQMCGR